MHGLATPREDPVIAASVRRAFSFQVLATACLSLGLALWQVASILGPGHEEWPWAARAVSAVLFGAAMGLRGPRRPFATGTFLAFEAPHLLLLTGWGVLGMMSGELFCFAMWFTIGTVLLSLADFALWSLGELVTAMLVQARVWMGARMPVPPVSAGLGDTLPAGIMAPDRSG